MIEQEVLKRRDFIEYVKSTRQYIDLAEKIKIIETEEGTTFENREDILLITSVWCFNLQAKGHNPTSDDVDFAMKVVNAWLLHDPFDRPVILAARPGFGKSTLLSAYLCYMVQRFPDTFGAVVVKERIADVQALVDEVNAGQGILQKSRRAFAIRGYDAAAMSREQYDAQFTDQIGYNVVAMTTKQFELQSLKDNLRNFAEFTDDAGHRRRRRMLLIDEKPALNVDYTLTVRSLNDFLADVAEAGRKIHGRRQSYYRAVLPLVQQLREVLESPGEQPEGKLPPLRPNYHLPRKLIRDFCAQYSNERLARMRSFEQVIARGGDYHVINGVGQIETVQKVHYLYTLFNAYILDGSGAKDPDYTDPDNRHDFFVTWPIDETDYSNVTFHVCRQYSLSRSSLRQSPESAAQIAAMIRDIVAGFDDKTLVVTYKEMLPELKRQLIDDRTAGKIVFKHFDGGRGTNQYAGINHAVYIGGLFKGTQYYALATAAALGQPVDGSFDVSKDGIRFHDNFVNGYRTLDMAVNMVQETGRLRAAQKINPVDFFIFSKNADLIDHVSRSYPGCRIVEYQPLQKLTGKKKAPDMLIDYFAGMEEGQSVKRSHIYSWLGITRKTMNEAEKNERVQRAMRQYNITRVGNAYVKG